MVIMMVKIGKASTDVLKFDTSAIWERRLCKVFNLFPDRRNIRVTLPLKVSPRMHPSLSNMVKTGRCLTKSSPPNVVLNVFNIPSFTCNKSEGYTILYDL